VIKGGNRPRLLNSATWMLLWPHNHSILPSPFFCETSVPTLVESLRGGTVFLLLVALILRFGERKVVFFLLDFPSFLAVHGE